MLDTDKKLILKQFEKYFTMVIKKNSREILIKSACNNRYFSEEDAGRISDAEWIKYGKGL